MLLGAYFWFYKTFRYICREKYWFLILILTFKLSLTIKINAIYISKKKKLFKRHKILQRNS